MAVTIPAGSYHAPAARDADSISLNSFLSGGQDVNEIILQSGVAFRFMVASKAMRRFSTLPNHRLPYGPYVFYSNQVTTDRHAKNVTIDQIDREFEEQYYQLRGPSPRYA